MAGFSRGRRAVSIPLRPIPNFVSNNKIHVLKIYDEKKHDLSTTKPMLEKEKLPVKLLDKVARLPTKGSEQATGLDLYAAEDTVILAKQRGLVDTKIVIALPTGTYGQIAPQSGLAVKKEIGAGVMNTDYQGSVKVLLIDSSNQELQVKKGDRVVQLIIEQIADVDPEATDNLTDMNQAN